MALHRLETPSKEPSRDPLNKHQGPMLGNALDRYIVDSTLYTGGLRKEFRRRSCQGGPGTPTFDGFGRQAGQGHGCWSQQPQTLGVGTLSQLGFIQGVSSIG